MTKRGYLKRRELAKQAVRTLTVVPDPWDVRMDRQAGKASNFGVGFNPVAAQPGFDFSALERRIIESLKVPAALIQTAAPGIAAQLEVIAEQMKTTTDAVAEELAAKVREEYLKDPPPEVEAAQRLTGTYLTRNEKKARLFGELYGSTRTGRLSSSKPNLSNIPRSSKGNP